MGFVLTPRRSTAAFWHRQIGHPRRRTSAAGATAGGKALQGQDRLLELLLFGAQFAENFGDIDHYYFLPSNRCMRRHAGGKWNTRGIPRYDLIFPPNALLIQENKSHFTRKWEGIMYWGYHLVRLVLLLLQYK